MRLTLAACVTFIALCGTVATADARPWHRHGWHGHHWHHSFYRHHWHRHWHHRHW